MGDYPNFTEHNLRQELMLARLHLDKMRPVYDAAMELYPHLDRMGRLSFGTAAGADAAQSLIDACRAAEEVERG